MNREDPQTSVPSEIARRVLDCIDFEGLIQCVCDLIAIPSLGGAETPAQEHVAALMRRIGMDVDIWSIDMESLRRHPRYATKIEREHAMGVVGMLGRGDGPSLALNGHVDVVPVARMERWLKPPWQGTVVDQRIYGRGAVDMKGPLSAAIFAVKAIADAGVDLRGRVSIQSVVGEEDGGVGTLATIERGHTADAAIVLEPTELAVAPAQAGALCFRVEMQGLSAHAALRDEGVNPIEKFIPLYAALMAFERRRNESIRHPLFAEYEVPYALSVGTLQSGVWDSSVPETLAFEGRIGVAIEEDTDAVAREFEAVVAEAERQDPWMRAHPSRIEWWGGQYRPASIPTDHPLVLTTSQSFREATGREPAIRGMRYGADMQLLVHEGGVPTILFGPGDIRQGHSHDEYVPIADLEAATRTIALTVLRYCGVAG